MSLVPNPEYDRPGFCCLCHIPIAEFDGPVIVRILPIARPMYLRLDDGSMLCVTTCDKCKDNFKPEDTLRVMNSVYKGWRAEIEKKGWSKEAQDEHMATYGEKFIVECDEKGMRRDTIELALGKENMIGATKQAEKEKILEDKLNEEVEKLDSEVELGPDN